MRIELIKFLDQHQGSVQTIITLFLTLFTAIYVFLTHKILSVTRQQHEAERRPYILIKPFIRSEIIVGLLITNVGKTPAEQVKLTLDKNIYAFNNVRENIRDLPLFKKAIPQILPNMEYYIELGSASGFFDETNANLPQQFTITAEYSFFGKRVKELTVIDIGSYFKTNPPPKGIIGEELKQIRRCLDKIESELKKKKF